MSQQMNNESKEGKYKQLPLIDTPQPLTAPEASDSGLWNLSDGWHAPQKIRGARCHSSSRTSTGRRVGLRRGDLWPWKRHRRRRVSRIAGAAAASQTGVKRGVRVCVRVRVCRRRRGAVAEPVKTPEHSHSGLFGTHVVERSRNRLAALETAEAGPRDTALLSEPPIRRGPRVPLTGRLGSPCSADRPPGVLR